MISQMAKESSMILKTVFSLRGCSKMGCQILKEILESDIQLEMSTKVPFKAERKMEKENCTILMEIYMMVNG